MRNKVDVVIIGAGMAGLNCARHLLEAGLKISVLEARDSVGGRAQTFRTPAVDFPLELGAEFIHGAYRETLDILRNQSFVFSDVCDTHFQRRGGKLRKVDFWKDIEKVVKLCGEWKGGDLSFEEFLKKHRRLPSQARSYARSYIEGFQAADPGLIGVKSIADAEKESPELNGVDIFRLKEGYTSLAESLLTTQDRKFLHLKTKVKKVTWEEGKVRVEARRGRRPVEIQAKAAVVTLPIGVLKAPLSHSTAVEIFPRPKGLDKALDKLQMGAVTRILFVFKSRFWEDLTKDPLGFLHAGPDTFFPTWWTLMPARAPVLIAWQGGPKSWHLSQRPAEERIGLALETLSQLTGISVAKLMGELKEVVTHEWNQDPHFLGAYSYVGVDGVAAASRLEEPFSRTLFFAGEGTQAGPRRGTVNGALASGERAAKQILNVLK